MYRVICEFHLSELVRTVNDLITEGWKPVGGVTIVTTDGDDDAYYQALYKEPEAK